MALGVLANDDEVPTPPSEVIAKKRRQSKEELVGRGRTPDDPISITSKFAPRTLLCARLYTSF